MAAVTLQAQICIPVKTKLFEDTVIGPTKQESFTELYRVNCKLMHQGCRQNDWNVRCLACGFSSLDPSGCSVNIASGALPSYVDTDEITNGEGADGTQLFMFQISTGLGRWDLMGVLVKMLLSTHVITSFLIMFCCSTMQVLVVWMCSNVIASRMSLLFRKSNWYSGTVSCMKTKGKNI